MKGLAGSQPRTSSDDSGFFQRGVSAVFRHGFQRARSELHGHEAIQLSHPEPTRFEVRREHPRDDLRDVLADAAFFLGETATMDDGAFGWPCFGNAANFHKIREWGGDNGGGVPDGQGEIRMGRGTVCEGGAKRRGVA